MTDNMSDKARIKALTIVARDALLSGRLAVGLAYLRDALKIKGFGERGKRKVVAECARELARTSPILALYLATVGNYWFSDPRDGIAMIADVPTPREAKVGDILVSSWGYDQTNIDFYKVIAVTAHTVRIRKLAKLHLTTDAPQVPVIPDPSGAFYNDLDIDADAGMVKRIDRRTETSYSVRIASHASASIWNGEPCHETGWGYGH